VRTARFEKERKRNPIRLWQEYGNGILVGARDGRLTKLLCKKLNALDRSVIDIAPLFIRIERSDFD
jgi:hypothetical protein